MSLDFTFKTQFKINLQISAEDTVVWLRMASLKGEDAGILCGRG